MLLLPIICCSYSPARDSRLGQAAYLVTFARSFKSHCAVHHCSFPSAVESTSHPREGLGSFSLDLKKKMPWVRASAGQQLRFNLREK